MNMQVRIALILLFLGISQPLFAKDPDCTGGGRWPASMAFVHLKNAGLTNNEELDFEKTEVVRISSERIDSDLYRQVHLIDFTEKSGTVIQVITVNDASSDECSMSGVEVFVVSQKLGGN